MKFEDHCRESIALFGKPFEEVHLWLDRWAGTAEYGYRHRKVHHHEEGIRQVGELFGPEAMEAARRHIISDLMEEGWAESDPFPRDEAHYVSLGLY